MHNRIPVTSVDAAQNLHDPPLDLANSEPSLPLPLSLSDYRREVSGEELEHEHGILVLAPEVLMQDDDVRGVLQDLQCLDLAKRRLVVVDLLEGDYEGVRSPAGPVDVGIGAGSDSL